MKDKNCFEFTGTVERFDRIQTKTGTSMISFSILCNRERIRVVAFRNLAEQTTLNPGDRTECRGHIKTTSWNDKNGQQRSGWQVIAHGIHRTDGDENDQQQERPRPPARQQPARQPELFPDQRPDTGDQFKYTDGPF